MKKFKLNAVLASVLSLGLICSSSVCASREGVEIPEELSEKSVTPVKSSEAKHYGLEKSSRFKDYEKYRESVVFANNNFKEALNNYSNNMQISELFIMSATTQRLFEEDKYESSKMTSKQKRKMERRKNLECLENDLKKAVDEYSNKILTEELSELADEVLNDLVSLSQNWNEETSKWFSEKGWENLPKNGNEFIKNVKEDSAFSEKLKSFFECPIETIDIKTEKDLFVELLDIADEIKEFAEIYSVELINQ